MLPEPALGNSPTTGSIVSNPGQPDFSVIDPLIDAAGNRDDNTAGQPAAGLRDALEQGRGLIHERFEQGATGTELQAWQSELIDRLLTRLWRHEPEFDCMALLAVGGYGRSELAPCSDIDLCVLLPQVLPEGLEARLAAWLTRLWDTGLELGYSVRSVADCEREAQADLTVITNLMEARLLAGDGVLLAQMNIALGTDRMWPAEPYLEAKLDEQRTRRRKFQSNAYMLEPNIKESQGGLRDIQMICWVAHRQFGTRNLADLVEHQLLTRQEFDTLQQGLELLWRIRYLLHRLNGRREDRLLFDHQRDIARSFGYSVVAGSNGDIEALMQRYYRTVQSLQRLNDILLQGLGGLIRGVTPRAEPEVIHRRFQLRNGFLEVRDPQVFMHYPPALLEVFLVFGQEPRAKNIRANTVRLIRSNLPLINQRFRTDPVVRQMFLRIFQEPDKLTRKIRMMNTYGVLAAYLPAFDAIVGRMQYDLFHLYTVDEHTIRVIRNLRRMCLSRHAEELPDCSEVARRFERPDLLYLTGLFHDIAKGRSGDHSELGAVDAREFCQQHGLNEADTQFIHWLVRHHLLMSLTIQRKDIADPEEQLDFARQVGSIERLDALYLLTVADIRATNPELWNSFKRSLLRSLYQSSARILRHGLEAPEAPAQHMATRRREARRMLSGEAARHNDRVETLWDAWGEDYFRHHEAPDIARHTSLIVAREVPGEPLVALRRSISRGATEVLIHTDDHEALFALITSVLDQLHLNIQSAVIDTTDDGKAVDVFYVLEHDGSFVSNPTRARQIESTLKSELAAPQDIPSLSAKRPSRRLKHFDIPTVIEFDGTAPQELTSLRISAADRPGILATIARALLRCEVSVHGARITTLGERIDDTFLVTEIDGQPLYDSARRQQVATQLQERM